MTIISRSRLVSRIGSDVLYLYGIDDKQRTVAVPYATGGAYGPSIQRELVSLSAGDTLIALTSITYVPGANAIMVVMDGLTLPASAYVETSASSITLDDPVTTVAEVEVIAVNSATPAYASAIVVVTEARFGARGNGIDDDTTAIQSALDYLATIGGGTLWFPTGTYLVSDTLTANCVCHMVGAGVNATTIQASHVSGAAITFTRYYSGVRSMTIRGSSARLAAANTEDVGVYFPTDSAIVQSRIGNYVRDCIINNHGSHAIYATGQGAVFEDLRILDCAGHGIYFDNFDADINNLAGFSEVKNCQIVRTAGHGICAGINRSTFRITLDNVDIFHCALASGIRQSAHSTWMTTENLIARNCGFGGWSGDSPSRVATVGGIYVNARSPIIEGNRFIDVATDAVTLGANAHGACIRANQIVGEVQVTLDPAVVVTSGCTGVRVDWGYPTFVTSTPMTAPPANSGNHATVYDLSPTGYRSALQPFTIADDAVKEFTFSSTNTFGILVLSSNAAAAKQIIVGFRVGTSGYCNLLTTAANVTMTSGVLAGTTGADGDLTISYDTSLAKLYIENRRGSSLQWMPTFLSLANGQVTNLY